ncbi:hypothetical protein [Bartonella sp. A05]|uniref:hypothetical protein n=1 Tax=Bartonella sp. A05 TaxID=2967261 RepID=UPI0022A9E177|nr:hypothetical protein [Bartonella sp. A05]MCZ2203423.1 hypothetical protein [Bartonella sp. A05]
MPNINNNQSEFLGNFSQRIDFFLGTLHHEQIVVLSYMLSAIILLCFVGHILHKGIRQKKILRQLQTKELTWKAKYSENHTSKT